MALSQRIGTYGFYWGNDFNSSNALNLSQMQINATYITKSLLDKGWTKNAIAGMLGNMQSESSINPGRWQSDRVGGEASGHGYGLVQWTPYTKYTQWLPVISDPSTMDNNLKRIIYEVDNNLQWIATETYPYSFSEFTKSTADPYTLGMMFVTNYERPAEITTQRGENARYWFEYIGGILPTVENKKRKKFPWVLYQRKLRNHKIK